MRNILILFGIILLLNNLTYIATANTAATSIVSNLGTNPYSNTIYTITGCPIGSSPIGEGCVSDKIINDLTKEIENKIQKNIEREAREKEKAEQAAIELKEKRAKITAEFKPLCNYCWDSDSLKCYNESESVGTRTCILNREGDYVFKEGKIRGSCEKHQDCLFDNCVDNRVNNLCRNVDFIGNDKFTLLNEYQTNDSTIKIYSIGRVGMEELQIYSKYAEYPFYNIMIIPSRLNPKIIIRDRENNFNKEYPFDEKVIIPLGDASASNLVFENFKFNKTLGTLQGVIITFTDSPKEEVLEINETEIRIELNQSKSSIENFSSSSVGSHQKEGDISRKGFIGFLIKLFGW